MTELFRALSDIYTSGGDVTYATTMGFSRARNAYHEASRAEKVLRFETVVDRYHGLPNPILYTAVSYAWGDPTPRHTILVDGRPRMIAQNLWEFLTRTEFENETRWLWIDALSISQLDPEERRNQDAIVSRMFSSADKVLVWLGDASDCGAMTMIGTMIAERYFPKRAMQGQTVIDFCERPYWHRLWVFQEIRRARRIELMCGQHRMAWSEFEALFDGSIDLYKVFLPSTALEISSSAAGRMVRLRRKVIDTSIQSLLFETYHLACAGRGDKVYAILSIATEGADGIEVDYLVTFRELGLRVLRNRYDDHPPASMSVLQRDSLFLGKVLGVDPKGYSQGTCVEDVVILESFARRRKLERGLAVTHYLMHA